MSNCLEFSKISVHYMKMAQIWAQQVDRDDNAMDLAQRVVELHIALCRQCREGISGPS